MLPCPIDYDALDAFAHVHYGIGRDVLDKTTQSIRQIGEDES